MNTKELINALDACRPASDDLRQPELRAAAEQVASDRNAESIRVRIERIDLAVSQAMHEVSPPAGLAERLVARLREAASDAAIGDAAGAEVSPSPVMRAASPGSVSRRRWLAWSAGLASAAAAVVAGVLLLRPAKPFYEQDLEAGRQWHRQVASSDGWRSIPDGELDEHELPSELRHIPRRVQDASSIVGREASAYDMSLPGRPAATLFVIPQSERAGVPSSPPRSPQSYTLGLSVAYWQTGGVLYVLVIESDRQDDYRSLLRAGSTATA